MVAYVNPRSASDADKPVKRGASLVTSDASGQTNTQALGRIEKNPRQFGLAIDNMQKGFRYQVSADGGESSWYTATVHPRPTIESLAVHYDYPAYMHLDPKVESNRADGAIDVWAGTKVTMTLRPATDPAGGAGQRCGMTAGSESSSASTARRTRRTHRTSRCAARPMGPTRPSSRPPATDITRSSCSTISRSTARTWQQG